MFSPSNEFPKHCCAGSELENDYKLLTFGIPSTNLLQNAKFGDLTLAREFLQTCRHRDAKAVEWEKEEEAKAGLILYPKSKDVLIGRGQPYRDLPGNAVWDRAIQALCERYRDSKMFEKTFLSMDVVKTVKDTGARFLERDSDGWKVLDDIVARKKTAVAFRNRARDNSAPASSMVGYKVPASLRDHVAANAHAAKRTRFDPGMELQQDNRQPGFFFPW
jgi:hypothetical protein